MTRLFPLPGLVMFPHVVQALHVFEPRYRALLEETLRTDRLISLASLLPGWQQDYESRPPISPVVCLGQVMTHTKLPDGRSNILVIGLRRARVVRELPPTKPFRTAQVELLHDVYPASGAAACGNLQAELLHAFEGFMPQQASANEQLMQLLGSSVSLGILTDVVAYSLHVKIEIKQRVLRELNVHRRARLLIELLEEISWGDLRAEDEDDEDDAGQGRGFPPDFSLN